MSTAGYLQDAKNQQKRLAETITSKGITATATEKYTDLVDKVAQIENLKGEERTLENFTDVLSEPKSVVQLEYPNDTPKTLNAKLGSKNLLSVMSLYPTITNNAVLIHFKSGQTYTLSMTSTYEQYRIMLFGTDINGTAFDATSQDVNKYIQGMYTGNTGRLQSTSSQTAKTLSLKCNTDCIITAIVFWNAANESGKTYSNVQLELGTTATAYEPYQGQTYTPTATGEVTGITNLYPTTTLLTDNAGVVFAEVTGGVYKEILPSEGKNGITKIWQPAVEETVVCDYFYDETTKTLTLLL